MREAAVVGLLRRAALEDDHRRDRVGAHQVGDVEALDAQRQRVEPERLLQPVERLDALLAAALGLELLLVERELGVALGEVEDAALVAALGGAQLDAPAAALGQRLGQRSGLRSRWTTICAGIDSALGVVLEDELLGDLAERRARRSLSR